MADGREERDSKCRGLLREIQRQYLQMVPIKHFDFKGLFENQSSSVLPKVLLQTYSSPLSVKYPPSRPYQRQFLRCLLKQSEESCDDVPDKLYEAYTDLISQADGKNESCYKSYLLPSGHTITLDESQQIIAHGTTGLSTWQASMFLSEWAIENREVFRNSMSSLNELRWETNASLAHNSSSWFNQTGLSANSSNNPAVIPVYTFPPPETHHIVFTIWLSLISFFGVLENSFVIHLTKSNINIKAAPGISKKREAMVIYFIYNLAWSDIAGSICTGVNVVYFYVDLYQETWSCQLIRFIAINFTIITVFLLLFISVERFISIVRPYQALQPMTAVKLIRSAWVIGFLVSVIGVLSYDKHRRYLNGSPAYKMECGPAENRTSRIFFTVYFLSGYLLPAFVITFCTLWTLIEFRKVIQATPQMDQQTILQKRKATKLLITVILAFLGPMMGYFCFHFINLMFDLPLSYDEEYIIRHALGYTALSIVTINPVIYFFRLNSFRRKLKRLFRFKKGVVIPVCS